MIITSIIICVLLATISIFFADNKKQHEINNNEKAFDKITIEDLFP